MECQLRVETGSGPQIWDKLLDGNWVLDVFLTPSGGNDFNGMVPKCDKPPTGQITQPRSGSEVKPDSRIAIKSEFDDDYGIKSVEHFVSTGSSHAWISLGKAHERGEGVYVTEWVVSYPAGTVLTFAASVTDVGDNAVPLTGFAAGVRVTDRDQEPRGEMTSPSAGAAAIFGRPLELSASVTDDTPLASASFYVRTDLEEWDEAGTDDSATDGVFSVEWTPAFPEYQPGVLLAFKTVVVDAAGHETELPGPNNVIVTQLKTKRNLSLRIVNFRDGSFGATGRLKVPSAVPGCKRGMVVRVERWVDNAWEWAGRAVTEANGSYSVRMRRDYASTFRAVLDEFTKADGNVCLAAISNKSHFAAGSGR